MNLADLINLSDVCSGGCKAARLAFNRKYPRQKFNLWINGNEIETWTDIWLPNANRYHRFHEKGLKCLRFLRNFGDLMFKLKIDTCQVSNNADKHLRKGIQHVRKFGTECRKKLVLRNYLPVLVRYPFKNIDKIEVRSANYSIAEFNRLVENVPNLAIHCSRARKYLNRHMPQMKRLKIKCWHYNGPNTIGDQDAQRALQLNPQIEELIISPRPDTMFKMKLNGSNIEIRAEGHFLSTLTIRPEQYDTMLLELTKNHSAAAVVNFAKKFINLKCLTMRYCKGLLIEAIETMPMLEKLQITVLDELELMSKIIYCHRIFSLAAAHGNLSILSFNFKRMDLLKIFQEMVFDIHRVRHERWSLTLNEDGPKEYKFSLVLNRIQT